jgi:AcrR family transcriptional regulator
MFTDRQQQIIETAIFLIAEKGIQNLTIKNVAQKIGITEPALYRHFKNKLEILQSVIDYFEQIMQPKIKILVKDLSPIKRIESFMIEHFILFNQNRNLAKVIFTEANFQNEDILLAKMNQLMTNSKQQLEKVIVQGQNLNEIRSDVSSTSIARMIIGSMRFTVIQWNISGMAFDLQNEGKKLSEDLMEIMKK